MGMPSVSNTGASNYAPPPEKGGEKGCSKKAGEGEKGGEKGLPEGLPQANNADPDMMAKLMELLNQIQSGKVPDVPV